MEKKKFTEKVKILWEEKPSEVILTAVTTVALVVTIGERLAGIGSKRAYARSVKLRSKRA